VSRQLAAPGWERELVARANRDEEFVLISRWTHLSMRLESDDFYGCYRVESSVLSVDTSPESDQTVRLVGSSLAWGDFLAAVPPANSHHFLAMDRRRGDFSVAAGRDQLIQNLRVVNALSDLMRAALNGASR